MTVYIWDAGTGSVWAMARTILPSETTQSTVIDIENDLLKKQREIDEYVFRDFGTGPLSQKRIDFING